MATGIGLMLQLKERAMPIFKILHPGCDVFFAFDNSQNHHAMAPVTLVASRLNLNDGGKHVMTTRNGWFLDEDGMRIEHIMQTVTGVQKGARTILSERNL
jgi:hypothetical protein